MGKKKKGAKKSTKKNFLDEVETTSYEQQISDNNKQLARLQARNDELEEEAAKLKENLALLEINKEDLVSHLQTTLDKKVLDCQELQEALIALDKKRKLEEQLAKQKEVKMETDFKTMENQLTAELKLAAGKLSALEDFRLARLELMKKFEEQEKQMAEQEVRHQVTLYDAKKELIINKTNMQNELELRLKELSESFRDATELRLADATQRVVRENLALQRELSSILEYCRRMNTQVEESKERERNLRVQSELYEAEAELALQKLNKQIKMIEKLAVEQGDMTRAVGRSYRAQDYVQRSEQLLVESRKSQLEIERKCRMLEQQIERRHADIDKNASKTENNLAELERLTKILSEAKQCIKEALLLQDNIANAEEQEHEDYEACSACCLDIKERLLFTLFNIFSAYEGQAESETVSKIESEQMDDIYKFGNLGVIPAGPDASTCGYGKSDDTSSRDTIMRTFCDDTTHTTLSVCTCGDTKEYSSQD